MGLYKCWKNWGILKLCIKTKKKIFERLSSSLKFRYKIKILTAIFLTFQTNSVQKTTINNLANKQNLLLIVLSIYKLGE